MNNPFIKSRPVRGVAMVEFAFILLLLLIILTGITELGRALYQQNTLYKSVEAGARYLARATNALDPDCNTFTEWATATAIAENLIIYGDREATGTPLLPNLDSVDSSVADITISARAEPLTKTPLDGEDVVENVCVISIDAEVDFMGLFGEVVIPFTDIATFKIRAETEERYIGL